MSLERRFKIGDRILDTYEGFLKYGIATIVRVDSRHYYLAFDNLPNEAPQHRILADSFLVMATPLMEALL